MQIASIAGSAIQRTGRESERPSGDGGFERAFAARTRSAETDRLDAAIAAYRRESTMTPLERARRDVLQDMKLSEEQIAAMPPADREAVEKVIAEAVAKRLRLPKPERGGPQMTADAFIARMAARG